MVPRPSPFLVYRNKALLAKFRYTLPDRFVRIFNKEFSLMNNPFFPKPRLHIRILRNSAIVLGIALVCFTVGFFMDGVNNTYLDASWESVIATGTPVAYFQKIACLTAVGFMISIIPGGAIAIFGTALFHVYRESLTEALCVKTAILLNFEAYDTDSDGMISDEELIAAYKASESKTRELLKTAIRKRHELGFVHTPEGGDPGIYMNMKSIEDGVTNYQNHWHIVLFMAAALSIALFVSLFSSLTWYFLAFIIALHVITWLVRTRNKAILRKFAVREFKQLDKDGDGIANGFELVRCYTNLAESERPNVMKLLRKLSTMGHETLVDGVPVYAVTAEEADLYCPPFARPLAN